MKKLEELGITPTPWTAVCEGPWSHMVWSGKYPDKELVAAMQGNTREADSALIAAAPDLYSSLREASIILCTRCEHGRDGGETCSCTRDNSKCVVKRWRAVLAAAQGEKTKD